MLWPLTHADAGAVHGVRSTQYRRLEQTAVLLGLRGVGAVQLTRISEALGLPFLTLRDLGRAFRDATRSLVRGGLVLDVLRRARSVRHPADMVLRAGHAAGRFKAMRWSPPTDSVQGELLALF